MKKILINLLIASSLLVPRSVHGEENEKMLCGIVDSYIPPVNQKAPHKIKLLNTYVIFWSASLPTLEFDPVDLVCKNICVTGNIERSLKTRTQTVTVRDPKKIQIVWKSNCK